MKQQKSMHVKWTLKAEILACQVFGVDARASRTKQLRDDGAWSSPRSLA